MLNLSGSTFYYWTLGDRQLSLAVPITNSLSFALTVIAGILYGEQFGSKNTVIGIALITIGVLLMIIK
jgi:uncharacterized membrane protein